MSETGKTFTLTKVDGHPAIICHRCSRTSFNRGDILHRYCVACHRFHDDVEARP